MEWYTIQDIANIDTPALVVYPQRVQRNIEQAISRVQNVSRLRPHVKTSKIAEVNQLLVNAGVTKFKCATIAEAEMLAMTGAEDVLLAYQPIGPKAHRLLKLVQKYPATHFGCLVDNAIIAEQLAALWNAAHITLDVWIDLNTGMNRSGIVPAKAVALYQAIAALPGIQVKGLHAYDGHIRNKEVTIRQQESDAAFAAVQEVAEQINRQSTVPMVIIAGGSPTFTTHVHRPVECSPGTFVFWDWSYTQNVPEVPFEWAALVITRVISIVDEHTITTDLGHKSVAAENPLPRVHFLNAREGATAIGQSEEHLVLKVPDSAVYTIGEVLYGVPEHICPTVALYERAVVVKNHQVVDSWRVIARDRMITV